MPTRRGCCFAACPASGSRARRGLEAGAAGLTAGIGGGQRARGGIASAGHLRRGMSVQHSPASASCAGRRRGRDFCSTPPPVSTRVTARPRSPATAAIRTFERSGRRARRRSSTADSGSGQLRAVRIGDRAMTGTPMVPDDLAVDDPISPSRRRRSRPAEMRPRLPPCPGASARRAAPATAEHRPTAAPPRPNTGGAVSSLTRDCETPVTAPLKSNMRTVPCAPVSSDALTSGCPGPLSELTDAARHPARRTAKRQRGWNRVRGSMSTVWRG